MSIKDQIASINADMEKEPDESIVSELFRKLELLLLELREGNKQIPQDVFDPMNDTLRRIALVSFACSVIDGLRTL